MTKALAGAGPTFRMVWVMASGRPAWAVAGTVSVGIVRSGRYAVTGSGDDTAVLFVSSSSVVCPSASATAMTRYVPGTDVLAGSGNVVIAVLLAPAARAAMLRAPSSTSPASRTSSVERKKRTAKAPAGAGPALRTVRRIASGRPACAVAGSVRLVIVRSAR